jgi:hypothetical protein
MFDGAKGKSIMKKVLSFKGLTLAAVSALVVAVSLTGGSIALAANDRAVMDNPSGTPGPYQQLRVQALENFYQRSQLVVQEQQLRIDLANQIASSTDTWIAALKGQGKDTSALEKALSDFKSKVSAAQTEHDQGASILNTHAGFDGSGKVTDVDQARDTLKQTRGHLRAAHLDLREGTLTLRKAIRDFRQANKPARNGKGPATEQPQ